MANQIARSDWWETQRPPCQSGGKKRIRAYRPYGILRQAFAEVMKAHPFIIDAIVILPDNLHALWTLPSGDDDFGLRWRQIKSAFSKSPENGERNSKSRVRKQERDIWQRRFWEHAILDERGFERHLDYVHYNPVKHGYTVRVMDWPHSSFHRYVRRGVLLLDCRSGD